MELTENHGRAKFVSPDGSTWTTHQASMKFIGSFKTGKVRENKAYRQAPKGKPGKYVKPQFPPEEKRRLQHQAQMRFNRILDAPKKKKRNAAQDDWLEEIDATDANKEPHEQALCERCQELGMCCVNFTKEVMTFDDGTASVIHVIKHRFWHQRKERLFDDMKPTTLYHQTDAHAAQIILATQKMVRGCKGSLGGGIYFAETPAATDKKALSKGVTLKCTVLLGNQKVLSKLDASITFTSLAEENYDSVRTEPHVFKGGVEHVVYNFDQVIKIEMVKRRK